MKKAKNSTSAKWDHRFIALARHLAEWSKDPTTKVGCVIVGPSNEVRALGYNGVPRNLRDLPSRLSRPEKYQWIEHAERNAVYMAARTGVWLGVSDVPLVVPLCRMCTRNRSSWDC